MKYTQYIQYAYIVFALFFIYDAITKYQNDGNYVLSVLFAAVALFMFFFKRHFYKKLKNGQK